MSCGVEADFVAGNTKRRRTSRCWQRGPCRVDPAGSSTSTGRKPTRNWPPCVAVCNAGLSSAKRDDPTMWPASSALKAKFAAKAAPRSTPTNALTPFSSVSCRYQPRQRSSIVVAPDGIGGRLPIARYRRDLDMPLTHEDIRKALVEGCSRDEFRQMRCPRCQGELEITVHPRGRKFLVRSRGDATSVSAPIPRRRTPAFCRSLFGD